MAEKIKTNLTDAQLENWAVAMESGRYQYGQIKLFDGKYHCALGVLLQEHGYEFRRDVEVEYEHDVMAYRLYKGEEFIENDYGVLDDLLGEGTVGEVYRLNDSGGSYIDAINFVRSLKNG